MDSRIKEDKTPTSLKEGKFFSLIGRLRYIDRWSLMRNARRENVAEHSFITELYGGNLNADRAAVLALYHEAAEVFTGDMPTPVKYYSDEIRTAYKAIEREAEKKLVGFLPERLQGAYGGLVSPDKTSEEYKFVKYADKIAALIKCNEELAAGNAEFAAAKESAEKSLRALGEKAVDYFLDTFAADFGLSLDESL